MSATHKSAMGKPVDMAAIRSRNEKVRAIGNMQVNARGDIIDSNNQVVNQATQRVNRVFNKTTTTAKPPSPPVDTQVVADEFSQAELEFDQELEDEIVPIKPEPKSKKR